MTIKLIVAIVNDAGLGKLARDNVAAWWMRKFCKQRSVSLQPMPKLHALINRAEINEQDVYCAITTTHMRNPGENIAHMSQNLLITPSDILIVHDEMHLQPGVTRLTSGRVSNTNHQGILNIEESLQSRNFHRLKIGIGKPNNSESARAYLCSPPSLDDKEKIDQAILHSLILLPSIIAGDLHTAKNHINAPRMLF